MKQQLGTLAGLAVFAIACADPVAIDRSLVGVNGPSLDLSGSDPTVVKPPSLGLVGGEVRLCKTTPAGDPSRQWSYTLSAVTQIGTVNPVAPTSPVVINGVAGQTVCHSTWVFRSSKPGGQLDKLTITEQVLPADWALTHIHVDMYVDGPGYVPPAPGNTLGGSLASRTVELYSNQDMQRIVTFTNDYTAPPPPTGNKGCTPGYWKQAHHFDSWNAPYDPTDDFDATFGVDFFNPNITLLAALELNGGPGGKNQLARAAVAALLNAAEGFSPMTVAQVISAVQGATPATYLQVKNVFGTNNELGCPLN